MLSILIIIACGPAMHKYDISSTVILRDEDGRTITARDVEICQTMKTRNENEKEYDIEITQCEVMDITNGIGELPNWEGEFRESHDTDIEMSMVVFDRQDQTYEATLIDDDRDVWCDNSVTVTPNEEGCTAQTVDLCENGYEYYHLWEIELPTGTFQQDQEGQN